MRIATVGADEGDGADDPHEQLVVREAPGTVPKVGDDALDLGPRRVMEEGGVERGHRRQRASRARHPATRSGEDDGRPAGPDAGQTAVPVEPQAGPLGCGVAGAQPSTPTINARRASRRTPIYYDTAAHARRSRICDTPRTKDSLAWSFDALHG